MQKDYLANCLIRHMSTRDIAKENNLSQSTIKYWLKKHNLRSELKAIAENKKNEFLCKCGESRKEKFYGNKRTICGRCHNQYTIRNGRSKKLKVIEYKGGKCEHCGFKGPSVCFDLHHVDPKQKDKKFAAYLNWTWERIKKEVDKCQLLCSNCHRVEHKED